jgi:hypothetical protein
MENLRSIHQYLSTLLTYDSDLWEGDSLDGHAFRERLTSSYPERTRNELLRNADTTLNRLIDAIEDGPLQETVERAFYDTRWSQVRLYDATVRKER